jgi:hypothetical protein
LLQTIVNKKIAFGLARAASIIGTSQALYRPSSANLPVSGVPYRSIYCAFDVTADFRMISTALPNHSYAALLADPSLVQRGDYLVGDDTHFVARVEPLRPALCVLCDQTIDVLNTAVATSAGTNSYGGHTSDTDTIIAQGWPVSMTARTRGGQDTTKLPSDTKAAYYDVLAPPIPGVTIVFGMRLQDGSGQNYDIVSAEFSPFGWRLLAGLSTT